MKKQKEHCYACDVTFSVTVTEPEWEEEIQFCPFCGAEALNEDDISVYIGEDE